MRDYGKIAPAFWTGETAIALRGDPEAQTIAFYVMTCPSASMIGLYYVPMSTIAHETGMCLEAVRRSLKRCAEEDLAYYDDRRCLMWVPNMARHQVGASLKPGDKRQKGVIKELEAFRKHPFASRFFEKYGEDYQLPRPDWLSGSPFEGVASETEAPSMPGTGAGSRTGSGTGSPLPPDGGSEDEPEDVPEAPASGYRDPLPKSERASWGTHWMRVYAEACQSELGHDWGFDEKQLGRLEKIISRFCDDRTRIAEWVESIVSAFVRATMALDDDPKYWSSHQPKGLFRWLNEGRPGDEPERPSRVHASGGLALEPKEPDEPVSEDERRRRQADFDALVAIRMVKEHR